MALLLLFLFLIVMIVVSVRNNRRHQRRAFRGVRFTVARDKAEVIRAIEETYGRGAKAAARALFANIQVTPEGDATYRFESRRGDRGLIAVDAHEETSSIVTVCADQLFAGMNKTDYAREGTWGTSVVLTHLILSALGYAPNVKKVVRSEQSVEKSLRKRLGAQTSRVATD